MTHKFAKLLCAAALFASGAAQAQVYKWTDAEGKLHYSDTPPPSNKAQTVDDKVSVVPAQSPSPQAVEAMEQRMERREKEAEEEREAIRARESAAAPPPEEPYRAADAPYYYPPYYDIDENDRERRPRPKVRPR